MLGSSFDGERANAARMISSMAEKKNLTITELIYGTQSVRPQPTYRPTKPRPAPKTNDKPKSRTLLQSLSDIASTSDEFEFTLTEWECQFADDVSKRYSYDYELSEKQIVIAEKIIRKAEIARQQGQGAPG
jgi:hypothetical protein